MAAAWKAAWTLAMVVAPSTHALRLQSNASLTTAHTTATPLVPTTLTGVTESNGEYSFGAGVSKLYYAGVELGGQTSFTVEYDIQMSLTTSQSNLWFYGSYHPTSCGLGFIIRHPATPDTHGDMYMVGYFSGTPYNTAPTLQYPFDDILPTGFDWGAWHTHRLVKSGTSVMFYIDHYAFDLGSTMMQTVETCASKFTFGDWVTGGQGTMVGSTMRNLRIYNNQAVGPPTTPAPTSAPTMASALGDPHLTTIHGERFDLMKPGKHVLINIPRKRIRNVLLRVEAEAQRFGGQCADLYFQELNFTGSWVYEKNPRGVHYHAHGAPSNRARWTRYGPVQLKVAHGHTQQGIKYLNIYVKGLARAGFAVGGLLGEDDHSGAAAAPSECGHRVVL